MIQKDRTVRKIGIHSLLLMLMVPREINRSARESSGKAFVLRGHVFLNHSSVLNRPLQRVPGYLLRLQIAIQSRDPIALVGVGRSVICWPNRLPMSSTAV